MTRLIRLVCVTSFSNRRLNGAGAGDDFDIVHFRASNREHKGGGVSKIALETDGPRALWQLRIQGIELKVDVAELPLGIGDALIKL